MPRCLSTEVRKSNETTSQLPPSPRPGTQHLHISKSSTKPHQLHPSADLCLLVLWKSSIISINSSLIDYLVAINTRNPFLESISECRQEIGIDANCRRSKMNHQLPITNYQLPATSRVPSRRFYIETFNQQVGRHEAEDGEVLNLLIGNLGNWRLVIGNW